MRKQCVLILAALAALAALAGCDGDHTPLHQQLRLGGLEAFAVDGVIPPGGYLLETEDVRSGRRAGALEVVFGEVSGALYDLRDDPVPHLGMRVGSIELDLASLEPPPQRPFRFLDLGTLFGLGHSPDDPLVVEFLDARGEVLGEPVEYGYIPNNSAHPEEIDPLRIAFSQSPEWPAAVRLSTPPQTFLPIVFFDLREE